MKPFATVLDAGTSLSNHTGSWRTTRPKYVHRLPPCNNACPAGENIQEWLSLVEQEKYKDAWLEMVKDNPFPAIMGRICYHTCEKACNRATLDSAVSINGVERFIGDMAIREKWAFDAPQTASGKKILIIGAGPAGLSAAYHLASMGHKVTIKEAMDKAGGMMRYGIPKYRLPRDILDAEVSRIIDLGVEIQTKVKESALAEVIGAKSYDAVLVAAGAPLAKKASVASDGAAQILDAVAVLREMEGKKKPQLGKRVIVYGGGNTAMDVARTAKRLGAEEVTIVYRRTREKMPAHAFEVEEALQEDIKIKFLSTIESVNGTTVVVERMELDKEGVPQPTGEKENVTADTVVLALGQEIDASIFEGVGGVSVKDGSVSIDVGHMTGSAGIFACGDMTSAKRTATHAIGQGKKAAKNIDAWLKKSRHVAPEKHDLATADRLNKWYYAEAARNERGTISLNKRKTTFQETQKGLEAEHAVCEARRCLSCGNCFECDNCYGVCPDNAIKKLGAGQGLQIDYEYCKGCGLCAAECPCGAIEMEPEKI
jgi:NADPH-dependent glutamate synthase beta subunit-like oxidoreductase